MAVTSREFGQAIGIYVYFPKGMGHTKQTIGNQVPWVTWRLFLLDRHFQNLKVRSTVNDSQSFPWNLTFKK